MIKALFFDVRSLLYGPQGPDLLAAILQAEGIGVTAGDVAAGLARLPEQFHQVRLQIRTEEQENDYYRAMLPELLWSLGVEVPSGALLFRILETLYDYPAWWSLYPETLPVLEALTQRGFTLGVIANWEPSLPRLLAAFEVDHYFQVILSSMGAGVAKPDPYLFRKALEAVGIGPEAALHCGPSIEEDVAGALSASITPVWINRTGISTGHEVLSITDLRGLLMLAQKAGE